DWILYGPVDSEPRIVVPVPELPFRMVIFQPFVIEHGMVTEDQVRVAVGRRDEDLEMVLAGKRELHPIPELLRLFVAVCNDEVDAAVKAGDELPGVRIAVNAAQHVSE